MRTSKSTSTSTIASTSKGIGTNKKQEVTTKNGVGVVVARQVLGVAIPASVPIALPASPSVTNTNTNNNVRELLSLILLNQKQQLDQSTKAAEQINRNINELRQEFYQLRQKINKKFQQLNDTVTTASTGSDSNANASTSMTSSTTSTSTTSTCASLRSIMPTNGNTNSYQDCGSNPASNKNPSSDLDMNMDKNMNMDMVMENYDNNNNNIQTKAKAKAKAKTNNNVNNNINNAYKSNKRSKHNKNNQSQVCYGTGTTGTTNTMNPTLYPHPRNLYDLWSEYYFGIGGRIPAKDFTTQQRCAVKTSYSKRKVFWDCISHHVAAGIHANIAIDNVYECYGRTVSVSTILHLMRRDRRLHGGQHPTLQLL